jgi:hypothetical protein
VFFLTKNQPDQPDFRPSEQAVSLYIKAQLPKAESVLMAEATYSTHTRCLADSN